MRRLLLLALVFITSVLSLKAVAQSNPVPQQNTAPKPGKLSGTIIDVKNKPIAYATVTLLKKDSTVANGDLTKEDGTFNIESIGIGDYLLRVNLIGYAEKYLDDIQITSNAQDNKLGKIKLATTSQVLSEVQITGEKALMEMSVDRKVFNVEKNITATGGSAADVLKNVPSLSVDIDGGVSLRGKETTILIDGKPATLLGGDIASALQSLPASSIQSVEVITNPSARYDAQGMSGIINIITKKDNRFGINGNVSIGAGTRDKYNAALGLNLRNNKWNIFFNSSGRRNKNYQKTSNERRLRLNDNLVSGSYEDSSRLHGGWFNTLGAEYTLNDRTVVTLTENINYMLWGNNGLTEFVYNGGDEPDSSQTRYSDNLGAPFSSSTSFDYKHKFRKPRREITSNITFAKTWVSREQEFVTSYFLPSKVAIRDPLKQQAPGQGSTMSLNGQADYTMPFMSKDGKLDAGWKSQLYWFESNNEAKIITDAGKIPDNELQNDYDYTQHIHALYTSVGDQKGKLGYQAGLRMEYSNYQGTSSLINDSVYANEFLNLFPSAYLSYKLPKDQAVYLSYTRRINRPNFFQMMPYRDVANPMDISVGNPNLIPEFIHNSELNYSRQFKKGHSVIVSGYYQYTQNLIDRIRAFDENTGIAISKPQNLNHGVTYGLELTGRAQILPIWDAILNVNFFRNEIFGDNLSSSLNNMGTSFFTKLNTNLKLPHNFSLQLNGTYEAPKVAAQGRVQEVYWMDVAIRKNLWSSKANVVLNISDIFNTRKYTNSYDFADSYQRIYRDRETRVGNITFTYRFGKSETRSSQGRRGQPGQGPVKERDNLRQGSDEGGF